VQSPVMRLLVSMFIMETFGCFSNDFPTRGAFPSRSLRLYVWLENMVCLTTEIYM